MQMQIKRLEIQMEKYNELQKLSKIEKHKVKPNIIPDFSFQKSQRRKKFILKIPKIKNQIRINLIKLILTKKKK